MIFKMRLQESLVFLAVLCLSVGPVSAEENMMANPLTGYTIHMSASHVMNGEVTGPFHHYCKPIDDNIIQCMLFESTDPNARLTDVEYLVSKSLVRKFISERSRKLNWHDHKREFAAGRLTILNPADPQAQKDLIEKASGTDGIIFHLWPKGAPIPDGTVGIAQSLGHWQSLRDTLE